MSKPHAEEFDGVPLEGVRFMRGLAYGVAFSLPGWAAVAGLIWWFSA